MKQVYQSKFFEIFYDEENSIFENRWLNSRQVTSDIFRSTMLEYVRLVKEYQPQNYLVDNKDNEFVISIEMQDWVNEHVFPHTMHNSVKKFAITVPEELFAQISLEQTIETGEKNIGEIPTRYFPTRDEAYQWLIS